MPWPTGSGLDVAITRYPRWMKALWLLGFTLMCGSPFIIASLGLRHHASAAWFMRIGFLIGAVLWVYVICKMKAFRRSHP